MMMASATATYVPPLSSSSTTTASSMMPVQSNNNGGASSLGDLHMHHGNTSRLQFNELLISAVESRPAIWDGSHPEHKNARRLAVLWEEISTELKSAGTYVTVKVVVERWRNLRDTYRKQLRKINHACQNGDGEIPRVRWMHFEQMSFLIPSLTTIRSCGSNANSVGGHGNFHNAMDDGPTMEMELPEHLRELETSDGDVHSVDNIFEMVEPILNLHSPTGSSMDRAPAVDRRSSPLPPPPSTSSASDEMSRSRAVSTTPPFQQHPTRSRKRRRSMTATAPSSSAAAATTNHVEGQFLQHLYQSTGLIQENVRNLQMVNHQLDSCLKDKPDPIEAFLYSLAPNLRATPSRLLPSLQMNLIYITSRYSDGIVPKELLQFDK